ncbi:MAG TPA: DUF5985 family protein [Verrucomicrobiae bacterium]|nr:DUF5985 family protein [Verrucomicrobiae bacterium]
MAKAMLAGAIMAVAWAILVFFLRFWRKTGDRLFVFFAAAFLLLGIERIIIVVLSSDHRSFGYLIRLFAFLLILFAILDKNRRGGKAAAGTSQSKAPDRDSKRPTLG